MKLWIRKLLLLKIMTEPLVAALEESFSGKPCTWKTYPGSIENSTRLEFSQFIQTVEIPTAELIKALSQVAAWQRNTLGRSLIREAENLERDEEFN